MADLNFYNNKTKDLYTIDEGDREDLLRQHPDLVEATPKQVDDTLQDIETRKEANTLAGTAKTFGGQAFDEAFMGIPEAIYDATATEAGRRAKDIYKEENPVANALGGALGFAGGLFTGPGALLMKVGTKVGGRVVKNKVGQAVIANAVEGGLYNAPANVIRASTDPNFAAEDAVTEALVGAFLGGAAGPAVKGAAKGASVAIDAIDSAKNLGIRTLAAPVAPVIRKAGDALRDAAMDVKPIKEFVGSVTQKVDNVLQSTEKKVKPFVDGVDGVEQVLTRKAGDTIQQYFDNVYNNIFKPGTAKEVEIKLGENLRKDADAYDKSFNYIKYTNEDIINAVEKDAPDRIDSVIELFSKQGDSVIDSDGGFASSVLLSKAELSDILTPKQTTDVFTTIAKNAGLKEDTFKKFALGNFPISPDTGAKFAKHIQLRKDRPLHFIQEVLVLAAPLLMFSGFDMGTAFTLGAISRWGKPGKDMVKAAAEKNSKIINAGVDTLFGGSVAARTVHMFQNKDEKQLAELTSDISRNRQDLDLVTDQLTANTSEMPDEVAEPFRMKFMEVITSVAESAPKVEYDRFGQAKPIPPAQLSKYRQELQIAFDPYSIIKDLESNTVTKIQVDSLRKLYPAIYGAITESILDKVSDGEVKISANKKRTFDLFMQEKASAAYIKSYQSMYVQANQPAQMGGGNSINAGDRLKTITLK